jgi:putative ATP-dependent endonuclease of OLD family
LLRRLLKYIADYAETEKAHFFLTTHSNVAIDMFSRSPNAQIIHVAHDGKQATSKTIESFQEHSAVLDDIGAKASDLLQANGVVWLEGPSDRIYFNQWVELYSGGKLQEHRDYECAFYGGAVLTHFEAKDSPVDCDAVNVLRVNRNAILIGDSDRKAKGGHLKPRLRNMKEAMEDTGGLVWVTDAREVENYIPAYALCQRFDKTELPEIEQYEQFYHKPTGKKADEKGYWQKSGLSGTFAKVDFARSIVQYLRTEDLDKRFDLKAKMEAICERIKKWNR